MSQRLLDNTRYLWCILAVYVSSAASVTVRNPPSPATAEAQAKFFQDFFSVQLSPYKMEFGHVCEDPNTWEQRYERKDFKNHRDMGKVRWGDKQGGYGEHYWDLNHAGNAGNHGDDSFDHDDGSYKEHNDGSYTDYDPSDSYDESNQQTVPYKTEEYDPEKVSYEESSRAKRAHPKITRELINERQRHPRPKHYKRGRKNKEVLEHAPSLKVEVVDKDEREKESKPRKESKEQKRPFKETKVYQEEGSVVQEHTNLYGSKKPEPNTYYGAKSPETSNFVPYEHGAGVRQHAQPEASASAAVPRLFLEPSTGHVVDRATGQAYVLQPINVANYN